MNKRLTASTAATVLGLTVAASSFAGPVQLGNGLDFGSNGSFTTSPIREIGYNSTLATSIYFGDPGVVGTAVVDTNEVYNYPFLGAAGNRTTVGGQTVSYAIPFDPNQININSLDGQTFPVDFNGFADGEGTQYGGGRWGLSYRYTITGVTTGPGAVTTGISFTSGYFDIFYRDGGATTNNNKQLLRLNVSGSQSDINNLDIFGIASFDFDSSGALGTGTDDSGGDSFVQNFFTDTTTGTSFYNHYISSGGTAVKWSLDTNVFPPVPSIANLWDSLDPTNSIQGIQGPLVRQSRLDGTIVFDVPEPGSLALFGLALAGLGLSQRRRKAS